MQKHERVELEGQVLATLNHLRLHRGLRRLNRAPVAQRTLRRNLHLILPLRQNIQNLHVIFLVACYQRRLFLEQFC